MTPYKMACCSVAGREFVLEGMIQAVALRRQSRRKPVQMICFLPTYPPILFNAKSSKIIL
jgi:hypothetical protein